MTIATKLTDLRAALQALGVQGFLLPVADEYLGEYVPAHARRLEWLTGFTGSAGLALVLESKAAFFTDGRYTLQAEQEIGNEHYALLNSGEVTLEAWLQESAVPGMRLGYDPRLHSARQVEKWSAQLHAQGIMLVPVPQNPLDTLWHDKPVVTNTPAFIHDIAYAGESSMSKRTRVVEQLSKHNADALFITTPEAVNWLLNIRGRDLEHTPVLHAYALLRRDASVVLYTDATKITPGVKAHLGEQLQVKAADALTFDIMQLGAEKSRVIVDPTESPAWFAQLLSQAGASVIAEADPTQLLKAVKNDTELAGIRQAHIRDGAAVSRFLAWLTREMESDVRVTETSLADKLEAFRAEENLFLGLSFPTIAGSGPNGAIVHYRAMEKNARVLAREEMLLLDSGAQYIDGTTDITRTLHFGTPTAEQKDRFTRVLKGHIALASVRFPKGTNGSQLDVLARYSLWEAGVDYDHGTGHGVGCALSVHEGPQRISKRPNDTALQPGMILSNEPGYYKAGAYGIRLENLVCVFNTGEGEGRAYYGFETLTCVPFDTRAVDVALLSSQEKDWLNGYHAWVFETLTPHVDKDTAMWLKQACVPQ